MAQPQDQAAKAPQPQAPAELELTQDAIQALAKQYAEALGEKSGKPLHQIALLIQRCGLDFVERIMAETAAAEAAGGLVTQDRKRRRTKGGVFFFLAKGQMDPQYRSEVFPNLGRYGDGNVMPPGLEWSERIGHMKALGDQPGQINNLTVSLIGRPGKLHIEGSTVMTVIRQENVKAPPYPKGVPPFDAVDTVTDFYVFMGLRHWLKVAKALENEDDMLIVDGSAVYDPQLQGIAILSTGVSTKVLEQQKRQSGGGSTRHAAAKTKSASTVQAAASAIPPRPDMSGLPEEVADKLGRLYDAADKLRQKIAATDDKDQRSGLSMTQRLLAQTEKQIATLMRQQGL